jgi:hypothetical protein
LSHNALRIGNMLIDFDRSDGILEGARVQPYRRGNFSQNLRLDNATAVHIVRPLNGAQHRQRPGRIEFGGGEHGCRGWTGFERHRRVEQQALQISRTEDLSAHGRDAAIGLLYVTSGLFRQAGRGRPEATGMQPDLEALDGFRGSDQRLRTVAPAAERIVDVVQNNIHEDSESVMGRGIMVRQLTQSRQE